MNYRAGVITGQVPCSVFSSNPRFSLPASLLVTQHAHGGHAAAACNRITGLATPVPMCLPSGTRGGPFEPARRQARPDTPSSHPLSRRSAAPATGRSPAGWMIVFGGFRPLTGCEDMKMHDMLV